MLELDLYGPLVLPSGMLTATFFQFLPNTFPFPPSPRPEYNPNNNHNDSGASSHPWSLAMYATDTVKSLQLNELPYSHIIVEKGSLTEAEGAWPMSGIINRVLESRSVRFHCLGTDFIVWALSGH